jgi:hypothetical protein
MVKSPNRKSPDDFAIIRTSEEMLMMRLGSVILTVALAVGWSASVVVAEQDAPRKLVAPVRGEAVVEITSPATKLGDEVVTTIRVRNVSNGPIAGFRVQENWFKGNEALSGDEYRHTRPFQVGEVIEIKLSVPRSRVTGARDPRYQFSHANGTIKTKPVKSLDLPKPAK